MAINSRSITGANAVFMLTIPDLYDTPQQLQGFAADDVFSTDALQSAETLMGVDGHLAGGFVFVEIKQTIALQADSPSNDVFDNWHQAQQGAQEVFIANGMVILSNLGRKWTMTRGFLTTYPPLPNAKKILQPRSFGVTWQSVRPAPA